MATIASMRPNSEAAAFTHAGLGSPAGRVIAVDVNGAGLPQSGSLGVAHAERQPPAAGREFPRGGRADAAARAGNKCDVRGTPVLACLHDAPVGALENVRQSASVRLRMSLKKSLRLIGY